LKKIKSESGILSRISVFTYGVLGAELSHSLAKIFKRLNNEIQKSGLYVYPPAYVALAFFSTIITTVSSGVILQVPFIKSILMTTVYNLTASNHAIQQLVYNNPFIISSLPFILPGIIGVLTFTVFICIPSFLSGSRSYALEAPYVSAYLSILTDGGVPINKAFEYLSMETSTLPETAKESKRLLRDIVVMGVDPLTAIDRNVSIAASAPLRDLLAGYVTTIRSGGDVRHFLEVKTTLLFDKVKEMVTDFVDRLQMLAEAFLMMLIIFPIIIIISTIISTALGFYEGTADPGTLNMFYLFFYGLAPFMAVMLIVMAKSMEPK